MINAYTIRNADSNGTLVEYHDDSGLNYSLNLRPAFNEDNSPMDLSTLKSEIMRHTIYIKLMIELRIAELAATTTTLSLPLNNKQTITAEDIENEAARDAAAAAEAAASAAAFAALRIEPITKPLADIPVTKL